MIVCFFWVQTGDGAMRQHRRCRNKIVQNPLVFILFSEIDAVKQHIVERVLVGQKSNFMGQICYKSHLISNDFVLRRLIDVEDEQMRIVCLARGFPLKFNIMNDARPKSLHQKRYKNQWIFNIFMFSEFIDKR